MANAIGVLYPYRYYDGWVFDDESRGLDKEAFVGGADTIIDSVIAAKELQGTETGFKLTFSATPFPDYDVCLTWVRGDEFGNWYRLNNPPVEGWLCPALFKYFDAAPARIYARFEESSRKHPAAQ